MIRQSVTHLEPQFRSSLVECQLTRMWCLRGDYILKKKSTNVIPVQIVLKTCLSLQSIN